MNIQTGIDTIEEIQGIRTNAIDLVLTDPPYDFDEDTKLYLHDEFCRVAKSGVIVFSPPENQWDFPYDSMEHRHADHFLFWTKPISTKNTSKSYSRFVEMIFVYKLEEYVWNTQYNWSNYTNILNDRVLGKSDHPYEKPESLIERLILLHSNEGQVIFDPFAGSGTIVRVAEKLGRTSLGWEKSEEYKHLYS